MDEVHLWIVLGSRTPVELEEDQIYEPNILFIFIARERADILEAKGVFGAPDLVIEILSAGTALYDSPIPANT